jgi:hypothetical protein
MLGFDKPPRHFRARRAGNIPHAVRVVNGGGAPLQARTTLA